jgi:hypothetical protein
MTDRHKLPVDCLLKHSLCSAVLRCRYGYSRNHGSPFQGIGVGVPMSRVYSHFMGGSIEWETDSWRRHTTVTLRLPKHGFTF